MWNFQSSISDCSWNSAKFYFSIVLCQQPALWTFHRHFCSVYWANYQTYQPSNQLHRPSNQPSNHPSTLCDCCSNLQPEAEGRRLLPTISTYSTTETAYEDRAINFINIATSIINALATVYNNLSTFTSMLPSTFLSNGQATTSDVLATSK